VPHHRLAAVALCLALGPAATVHAEIVRLTNGRTMTVLSAVFEGEHVILQLPGGGEIRAHRSLVAELLPDEVPFAKAVAIQALEASAAAARPSPSLLDIHARIDRIAQTVGIDRRLVHAVVRVESNYDPRAISPKGAMGLMQLMPATARQYRVEDPFDVDQNLEAGMRHLRGLLNRFDRSRALAAYNAGEGAVSKYGGVPPYRETQDYVRRILALVK